MMVDLILALLAGLIFGVPFAFFLWCIFSSFAEDVRIKHEQEERKERGKE